MSERVRGSSHTQVQERDDAKTRTTAEKNKKFAKFEVFRR
jgi:hypothetical protein